MSPMPTRAPARTSAWAVALPIPRAPPEIATTLPFRFLGCCFAMSLLGPKLAGWPNIAPGNPKRTRHSAAIGSAPMRAIQIVELTGPGSLELNDVPEPGPSHMLAPDGGVIVDVKAAGVSFPEVLQSRGEYQLKPPTPFVPGSEVAGIVRSAPDGASVSEGDRVAACCMLGGFAEVAVAPPWLTFPLPDELEFAQGAALVLNYHTAYFSLKLRGRLQKGDTVLVHGAAGGVGTASIQVAN